jgi:homoprotocatechuate degradation regulator HpaR
VKPHNRAAKKRPDAKRRVPLTPVSGSLPIALMRAREAVMSYFRPSHSAQGITDQQWRVLRVLYQENMEVTELARHAALQAPSVSRILKDFETSGLIERCAVEGDMRRSLVRITPAGINRLAFGAEEVNATYREIIRRFGRRRMDRLLNLLDELEEALTERALKEPLRKGKPVETILSRKPGIDRQDAC